MRWQKQLRFAIALFVVVFAAVVVVSLRKGRSSAAPPATVQKKDPKAVTEGGTGTFTHETQGKTAFSIAFGNQLTYEDGRSKFGGGVTVVLPDKNGRQITVKSQDAEVTPAAGDQKEGSVGNAVFSGGGVENVLRTMERTLWVAVDWVGGFVS